MISKENEKDVEFALWMLNSPSREENSAFREWIRERGHRELFWELLCMREAGMAEFDLDQIDLDRMWWQFDRKTRAAVHRKLWSRAVSVAAVLILGCGIYGLLRMQHSDLQPISAQVEYNLGKGVTLLAEANSGQVEDVTVPEVKNIPGVSTFIRDSLRGISYSDIVPVRDDPMKHHTLLVPRAADYMVVLEDSTFIWVNAESELRYPTRFGEGERIVELRGEAYFKVRQDTSRPFIVRTDRAETRVLGTEFNIQAYPGQTLNVTLVTGSVGVKADMGEALLRPGENVALTTTGLKIEQVDVLKYTSWKNGYFYYDNTCLNDILGELGRWYNFKVRYEEEVLKELQFKFWAGRYEPLKSMLVHLNETQRVKLTLVDSCIVVGNYR